jgi:hypothetical protein
MIVVMSTIQAPDSCRHTDIKSKTGRPQRHASKSNVRAIGHFLSRWNRYGRHPGYDGRRLSSFAVSLAMWREFTQAGIQPPVLSKLSAYRRACLEQSFAEGQEELEEILGRPPRPAELASYVASWFRPQDPLRRTGEKQAERLLKEANDFEYWSGVPAQYIPYTGLRPSRPSVEAFWRWYRATFHSQV